MHDLGTIIAMNAEKKPQEARVSNFNTGHCPTHTAMQSMLEENARKARLTDFTNPNKA